MASTARGSGSVGGDRRLSRGKGKNPVGPHEKPKKLGASQIAMLHYMEKEHEKYVARGEEPPFDIEELRRPYALSPPNPEVPAPQSSSAIGKNPSEHSASTPKNG